MENLEMQLNRFALENKDFKQFFIENIKNKPLKHQFEFLYWLTENNNIEAFKFLLDYPQIDIHMFEDFCFRYSAGCGYLDLVKFFF